MRQNGQFVSEIKMARTVQKTTLQLYYSYSIQKTTGRNTQQSRNDKIMRSVKSLVCKTRRHESISQAALLVDETTQYNFVKSKECSLLNMTLMNLWVMSVKYQISYQQCDALGLNSDCRKLSLKTNLVNWTNSAVCATSESKRSRAIIAFLESIFE